MYLVFQSFENDKFHSKLNYKMLLYFCLFVGEKLDREDRSNEQNKDAALNSAPTKFLVDFSVDF